MPHSLSKKRPAKESREKKCKKKVFFVAVAAEPAHGGRAHGKKIRLAKKIETEKNRKK